MKYFKIEGTIEIPEEYDLDFLSDKFLNSLDSFGAIFGGGMKEVDADGNDIETNP